MSTQRRTVKKTRKAAPRKMVVYKAPPRARAPRAAKADTFLGIEKPNSLGANIGAFVGHGAQQLIKSLTGFGDYHIDKNSILEGGMSPPSIVNTVNRGGFIVRHREYIADIVASTAYTNQTFDINPGLSGSFPYLSQIAKAFEMYRMRGLVYEFKSMSSDAVLSSSASSALGTVAMATQYNSLSAGFTNLIALENHEFSCASKPSMDFYHPVECKKSLIPNSELYTRTGAVPDNADIRLYDLGQFNIATSGMQNATGVIGQLWCTYEVEFYQAKYDAPTGILSEHVYNTQCSNSAWLGTVHSFRANNSLGIGVEPNVLTFPDTVRDGTYFVVLKYLITSPGTLTLPTITPLSGYGVLLTVWNNGAGNTGNSANSSGGAPNPETCHICFIVKVLKPSLTITFSGGVLAANTVSDLFVTQYDADIST